MNKLIAVLLALLIWAGIQTIQIHGLKKDVSKARESVMQMKGELM